MKVCDEGPLRDCVRVAMDDDQPLSVTEQSVARKFHAISSSRVGDPDDLPNSLLRVFADILSSSFSESVEFLEFGSKPMARAYQKRQPFATITKI